MKSKARKKSKHDLPSLDFVTTLSIDECRERLLIMNRVFDSSRQIDAEGDRDFYVQWRFRNSWTKTDSWLGNLMDIERYVAGLVTCRLSYWGSLSEGDTGTRVQLIPTRQSIHYVARRASLAKLLNIVGMVVYGTLILFGGCGRSVMNIPFATSHIAAPVLLFIVLSLVLFGPLVYLVNVQLRLSHNTRREVEQIREALDVPGIEGEYRAQAARASDGAGHTK